MGRRSDVPEGIEVEDLGFELRITRRPSHCTGVLLAVVALFCTGISWGFLLTSPSASPILIVLGVLGPVLVYWALTMLVNKTEIQINRQELIIRQGPLPRPGVRNRMLPIRDIREFSCLYADGLEEQDGGWSSGRTTYSWDLHAIDAKGQRVVLITGIDQASHASFLESELRRFLRTRVRPAKAEARPAAAQGPGPQTEVDEPRLDLEAALAELDELGLDLRESSGGDQTQEASTGTDHS